MSRRKVLAGGSGLAAAGLAGCLGGGNGDGGDGGGNGDDGGDGGDGGGATDLHLLLLEASMYVVPLYYGQNEGVFEDHDINISFEVVGFGQFTRGFTNDLNTGLGTLSSVPLAEQIGSGEADARMFGQHMNFINQCFTREDSDIEEVSDLEGSVLGVPGLGSSTTRTYIAQWEEEFGFDLENDVSELVDSNSSVMYEWLANDEEIDAAILFTSYTIESLANPDLQSIYHPGPGWQEVTGQPPSVNMYGAFNDLIEDDPQAVLNFWDAWVESVELFRENYEDAMGQFAALGGLGADDEAGLEVVQEMVSNQELFPLEWNEEMIESNMTLFDAVHDQGLIESSPSRDGFILHDELEDMV